MKLWQIGATIALSLAALGGAYKHGYNVASTSTALKAEKLTSELADANLKVSEQARILERQSAMDMATIDNAYQKGRSDAQAKSNALIGAIERGNVRVRERLTCPANGLPTTSTATSGSDAAQGRGLQQSDAAAIIAVAEEADEVVRQLWAAQATIRAMEKACKVTTSGH